MTNIQMVLLIVQIKMITMMMMSLMMKIPGVIPTLMMKMKKCLIPIMIMKVCRMIH